MAVCENEECGLPVKDDRWSRIRAHAAGWYFQKDGRVFCPSHRPHYAPTRPV